MQVRKELLDGPLVCPLRQRRHRDRAARGRANTWAAQHLVMQEHEAHVARSHEARHAKVVELVYVAQVPAIACKRGSAGWLQQERASASTHIDCVVHTRWSTASSAE